MQTAMLDKRWTPRRHVTRRRYARELLATRRALVRASDRANDASTWALICCFMVIIATTALVKSCGQAAQLDRDVLTVAKILERQTEVLITRLPAKDATPAPALDLPAAIAGGA